MTIAFYALASISVILFLVLGIRLFQLRFAAGKTGPAIPEIDPSRYLPMQRMLREEEFQFLARQGLDPRSIRQLRAERRAIFRKYLRALSLDFSHIASAIRFAMLESNVARPELATALFRARAIFAYAVLKVNVRLTAHALGISTVAIEVRPLIEALEVMRQQCGSIGNLAASAA